MMASKSARQLVDDAYDALFGRGDLSGFLADFDENSVMIEAESLPYGGTFRGRDTIKAAIEQVFAYWRDFAYEVEAIADSELWVMAYGRFRATSVKTGKQLDIPLAEVWHIRDGKVMMISPIYSDTKLALNVLG
jgi:ketosteroid isomerase-like protein